MTILKCKECSKEFTRTTNNGVHLFCCEKCQIKNWQDNNPFNRRLSSKRWRKLYPNKQRCNQVRARALEKGLEFDLTPEDFIPPKVCPVLGIPIFYGTDKQLPNSPSIDRINPEGGYTKGNVRMISQRANTLKSNATIKELELILADARKIWEL